MRSSNALLAAMAASVAAKTITINVGESGLTFTPDTTTADIGDTIEFHFFASLHSAVQGDFNNPCQRASSGFNSGPINNNADGSVRRFSCFDLITYTYTSRGPHNSIYPSIMLIPIARGASFKSQSRTPTQCGFTAAQQAIARVAWLE
jgi:plastocyanin